MPIPVDHFTLESGYWTDRYRSEDTPWDLGEVSPPLKEYFDSISKRGLKILVPGAGSGHEVQYLHQIGFSEVFYLDFSPEAARKFSQNHPTFPPSNIFAGDFFQQSGSYDLIVEQTFFCSFHPGKELRSRYAEKAAELLKPAGKLIGLWWNFPLEKDQTSPPYGGSMEEYCDLFQPYFSNVRFFPCRNSHPSREGKEYFAIMEKRG